MSDELHCPTRGTTDHVHRYVAGTLPAEELEAFEIHLLECGACQEAVHEGAAIRQALLAAEETGRRNLARRTFAWALPLAAAAILVIWIARLGGDGLEALGGVGEPPVLVPLSVRAQVDSATLLADRGMEAYRRGEYGEAAALLESAATPESGPGLHFFLGMARLLDGRPREAVPGLESALEPSGNPYAAEAHFYLAKAWLRLGRADPALAHLASVPAQPPDIRARADALADSVRSTLR